MTLAAVVIALLLGGGQLVFNGFKQTVRLFDTVWLRLLLGFALGGLIKVLIPSEVVARWLGHASGVKGIVIGSYIGVILPGAPYVFLPVVASIYAAGAGVGPVIGLMVSRALLSINTLVVWQIPFLGAEISLARYITSLLIPPVLGIIGATVFKVISRPSSPDTMSAGESATALSGKEKGENQ